VEAWLLTEEVSSGIRLVKLNDYRSCWIKKSISHRELLFAGSTLTFGAYLEQLQEDQVLFCV
jgi:hypothetical protein